MDLVNNWNIVIAAGTMRFSRLFRKTMCFLWRSASIHIQDPNPCRKLLSSSRSSWYSSFDGTKRSPHARVLGLTSQQVWATSRRLKIYNRHNSPPHDSLCEKKTKVSWVKKDVVGFEMFIFQGRAPLTLETSFSTSKSIGVCPRVMFKSATLERLARNQ